MKRHVIDIETLNDYVHTQVIASSSEFCGLKRIYLAAKPVTNHLYYRVTINEELVLLTNNFQEAVETYNDL
jgi:hypothetical protein